MVWHSCYRILTQARICWWWTRLSRNNPSVAVEFDTYYNGSATDPVSQSDHVAFVLDGNAAVIPPAADISEVNNLENGNFHNVILLWDPDSQELSYELTHSDGTVYTNTKNIDLIGHLSSNIAFWGFTAATGGQSIDTWCEWMITLFVL